jgi:hypothetical protein
MPVPKSYTNYKAIIISKLESIKDDQTPTPDTIFAEVLGTNTPSEEGYPLAYVLEKTGGGNILDTHRNEREWQFDIVIHQEVGNKTAEQAYQALLDAVDRVIKSFDEDPMLLDVHGQNQCKWVRVVPVGFEYSNQETAVHRALLTVAIVDVVNRFVGA